MQRTQTDQLIIRVVCSYGGKNPNPLEWAIMTQGPMDSLRLSEHVEKRQTKDKLCWQGRINCLSLKS
jgi:hypothetical protein